MAFEPLDWEITRSSGNIRYVGADPTELLAVTDELPLLTLR